MMRIFWIKAAGLAALLLAAIVLVSTFQFRESAERTESQEMNLTQGVKSFDLPIQPEPTQPQTEQLIKQAAETPKPKRQKAAESKKQQPKQNQPGQAAIFYRQSERLPVMNDGRPAESFIERVRTERSTQSANIPQWGIQQYDDIGTEPEPAYTDDSQHWQAPDTAVDMVRMPGKMRIGTSEQGDIQSAYGAPAKTPEVFLQELLKRHQQLPQNAPDKRTQRRLPDGTQAGTPEEMLQVLLEQSRKAGATDKKITSLRPKNASSEANEKLIERLLKHQPQLTKEPKKANSTQKQTK